MVKLLMYTNRQLKKSQPSQLPLVDAVVDVVLSVNSHGTEGDGKIFVLPVEESIRIHLLPREEWDDYEFEFKTKDLLRASYLQRIASNKDRILSGQASPNEIRREEGDAPDENGDFLLVPVNMTTAERMKKGTYGAKANEE